MSNEVVFQKKYPARGKMWYEGGIEVRIGVPTERNEQGDTLLRLEVGSYRSMGSLWLTADEASELAAVLRTASDGSCS